jgi:hypothetical protein
VDGLRKRAVSDSSQWPAVGRTEWLGHIVFMSKSAALKKIRGSPYCSCLRCDPFFTIPFYGAPIFRCKTAQFSETLREPARLVLALKNRVRKIVKNCANTAP